METLWRTARVLLAVLLWLQLAPQAQAIKLDATNPGSIKDVSRQLSDAIMKFYDGDKPGQTPGLVPAAGAFNWWEAGAMFGQMVEYWYYTGDDRYNEVTKQALIFQAGPEYNYEPKNQSLTEGNDDQAFWAFAAMSAAEMKFPNPTDPKQPSWLSLAQAVFNRQAARWDDKHCNGGLRWQFNPLNNGWMMKNTISNGCFFQLAARLARYTKNETYAQWADKTYDWLAHSIKLVTPEYEVYDGVGFSEEHCNDKPGMVQWTYNIGTMLAGSAFMYNHTNGDKVWKDRIQGYLDHLQKVFFPADYGGKTLTEYACEIPDNCNKDQRSFKGYLTRWLAVTAQIAPFTQGKIMPWLKESGEAAARACTAAGSDVGCGLRWYKPDDGQRDIGHLMMAQSVVQANLVLSRPPLADVRTGNSSSNPNAGIDSIGSRDYEATRIQTMGDKVGAWILTVLALLTTLGGAFALLFEKDDTHFTGFIGGSGSHRRWR